MILDKKTRLEIEMFAVAMDVKLDKKQKEYGDSWKTCDIEFLRDRLMGEFKEWHDGQYNATAIVGRSVGGIISDERKELVDIANICMMLWNRHCPLGLDFENPSVDSSNCQPNDANGEKAGDASPEPDGSVAEQGDERKGAK